MMTMEQAKEALAALTDEQTNAELRAALQELADNSATSVEFPRRYDFKRMPEDVVRVLASLLAHNTAAKTLEYVRDGKGVAVHMWCGVCAWRVCDGCDTALSSAYVHVAHTARCVGTVCGATSWALREGSTLPRL